MVYNLRSETQHPCVLFECWGSAPPPVDAQGVRERVPSMDGTMRLWRRECLCHGAGSVVIANGSHRRVVESSCEIVEKSQREVQAQAEGNGLV